MIERHDKKSLLGLKNSAPTTIVRDIHLGHDTYSTQVIYQGGEKGDCLDVTIKNRQTQCDFVVEPTGADDPAQNGGVETWNGTFAVTARALLYGAALLAIYWSAALLHAVFLHNVRVHSRIGKTPHEVCYGSRPDLKRLKMFGSRVCVKRSGRRCAKLDKHNFSGIFIG